MKLRNHHYIKNAVIALGMLPIVCSITGCYQDKEELLYPGGNQQIACDSVSAKFGANIQPIILSKCAIQNCHNGSAAGGFTFQNYSQISGKKDRINIRVVVEKSMPPTGALPPAEINQIRCWIEGGALNN